MPAECRVKHVPGSQSESLCRTHGARGRGRGFRPPAPTQGTVQRGSVEMPACDGDSSEQRVEMLAANGPIDTLAAQQGLLPLNDRGVSLRKAATGKWLVRLTMLEGEPEAGEYGFGRTPEEAFYAALTDYTDAPDGADVLISRDPENSLVSASDVSAVYVLDLHDERDSEAARPSDDSARAWLCRPDGVFSL